MIVAHFGLGVATHALMATGITPLRKRKQTASKKQANEETNPTPEPSIGQPSTTVSPSDVPPACQSHYDNYEDASSGIEVLVTLSVLEQSAYRAVETEVRAFVAQLDCDQIRTLAGELGVWESSFLTGGVSVLTGAACQRFGLKKGLPAYATPAAYGLGTAAAVTASLSTE